MGEFDDIIGAAVPDEEPEPAQDEIVVVPNAFGPGADSVRFASGEPVGVWMRRLNLDPEVVEVRLLELGLDEERAARFRREREMGIDADREIMGNPAVQAFARVEAEHYRKQAAAKSDFVKGKRT